MGWVWVLFLGGRVGLVKSWAGSSSQEQSAARARRAWVTAAWAASVGWSQGCPSCAAAQTKIPFFPCLVGSPPMREPCPTNRNQTSVFAMSLIKHAFFTNLCKRFDPLPWCKGLRRFSLSCLYYGFDRNTVGKFILGVFLICISRKKLSLWTYSQNCYELSGVICSSK